MVDDALLSERIFFSSTCTPNSHVANADSWHLRKIRGVSGYEGGEKVRRDKGASSIIRRRVSKRVKRRAEIAFVAK